MKKIQPEIETEKRSASGAAWAEEISLGNLMANWRPVEIEQEESTRCKWKLSSGASKITGARQTESSRRGEWSWAENQVSHSMHERKRTELEATWNQSEGIKLAASLVLEQETKMRNWDLRRQKPAHTRSNHERANQNEIDCTDRKQWTKSALQKQKLENREELKL
jgi:hypothetical protein